MEMLFNTLSYFNIQNLSKLTKTSSSTVNKKEVLQKRKELVGSKCQTFFSDDPFYVSKGFMQYLYDENGKKFIDCISNVQHVGHCHPDVVQAISKQLSTSTCNIRFISDKLTKCAEEILKTLPGFDTILFCNSGSEANDLALRMAQDFTGNSDLIVAYHGHITSTMQISPYKFNHGSTIKKPDWVHVAPVPDVYRGTHKLIDEEISNKDSIFNAGQFFANDVKQIVEEGQKNNRTFFAFITEAFQSCGGQIITPKGYMKTVADIMHKNNALIIVDEVQTGFGRIGKTFWAHQLYKDEYVPDIVTMGKSIGNGFPVAAVVTRKEIADKFGGDVDYFNTYGGNPVACAAVLEVINVINRENLINHVQKMEKHFAEKFDVLHQKYEYVGDVKGIGMFWGLDLVTDRQTRKPATELAQTIILKLRQEHNIILNSDGPHKNVLKFKPPLCFNKEDLTKCVEALEIVLKEFSPLHLQF